MERRTPNFDPRMAALNHAGMAASKEQAPWSPGDMASAVACGLVYVGDQIAALTEELKGGQLGGVASLLEQLDVTVNNTLVEIERTLENKL